MLTRYRSTLLAHGLAAALVAAALLLASGARALFNLADGYFFFAVAVVLSARLGGFWPGLLATVLSALVANYYLVEPTGSLDIHDPADRYFFTLFLIEGAVLSALASHLRPPGPEVHHPLAAYTLAVIFTGSAVLLRLLLSKWWD